MSKTIVITGASRGIGFALTQLALQEGHRIYALSRNIQPLKKSERLYPYRIDLTEEQSLHVFAEQLQKEGIKIRHKRRRRRKGRRKRKGILR